MHRVASPGAAHRPRRPVSPTRARTFHWFRPDEALREFARVLRPGGRLALLWNLRDAVDPMTREYDRIVSHAAAQVDPGRRDARQALDEPLLRSDRFVDARRSTFDSPQSLDEAGLVGRAWSASYFPRTEPLRGTLTDELRAAFRSHSVDGRVTLHQTARLTLAERR
jgi:SAM-dependent methyltransferase